MDLTALRQIDFATARQIAERKGVQPTKVRGTNTLRFSNRKDDRLEVITWDEFEKVAVSRRLAVYESGGWMKLMRRP